MFLFCVLLSRVTDRIFETNRRQVNENWNVITRAGRKLAKRIIPRYEIVENRVWHAPPGVFFDGNPSRRRKTHKRRFPFFTRYNKRLLIYRVYVNNSTASSNAVLRNFISIITEPSHTPRLLLFMTNSGVATSSCDLLYTRII